MSVRAARFVDDGSILNATTPRSLGEMASFFSEASRSVSFRSALIEAGANADYVISHADAVVARARQNGVLERLKITPEDARVIAGYTVEVPSSLGESMYTVLNVALRGNRCTDSLLRIRNLFMMFLRALRLLPRVTSPVVYRGVSVDLGMRRGNKVVMFPAFSSTSCDLRVAEGFIRHGEGTLLALKGSFIGYDVRELSEYPVEKEVLLEPETQYIVTSVVRAGITRAECEYRISTPVLSSLTALRGSYNFYTAKYSMLFGKRN